MGCRRRWRRGFIAGGFVVVVAIVGSTGGGGHVELGELGGDDVLIRGRHGYRRVVEGSRVMRRGIDVLETCDEPGARSAVTSSPNTSDYIHESRSKIFLFSSTGIKLRRRPLATAMYLQYNSTPLCPVPNDVIPNHQSSSTGAYFLLSFRHSCRSFPLYLFSKFGISSILPGLCSE